MRLLGIDYGTRRIGLAFADEVGIAVPIPPAIEPELRQRLAHIGQELQQRRIEAIVIGLPLHMDGTAGKRVEQVEAFIKQLEKTYSLPVHRIDERLSSSHVEAELRSMGRKQDDPKSGKLDSRAAALILQDFLEAHQPTPLTCPGETDYQELDDPA